MWWMYTGYLAAYYLASAANFVVSLPNHRDPHQLAIVSFGIVPGLVVCLTAELLALLPDAERQAVRIAFQTGRLTRRLAFGVGFGAGLVGVAGVFCSWHSLWVLDAPLLVHLLAIPVIILLTACLGGGLIMAVAQSHRPD